MSLMANTIDLKISLPWVSDYDGHEWSMTEGRELPQPILLTLKTVLRNKNR